MIVEWVSLDTHDDGYEGSREIPIDERESIRRQRQELEMRVRVVEIQLRAITADRRQE